MTGGPEGPPVDPICYVPDQPFLATRRRRRLAGAFLAAAFFFRRRLAGAFLAAAFFVRRRLAGAFLAAAFFVRRRLAALFRPAFFAAALRVRRLAALALPAFLAAAFRRRFAGAAVEVAFFRRFAVFLAGALRVVFLATRRFAGLRAVVFFAVDFRAVRLFAGGTVTTFLEGLFGCRRGLLAYLFTADLKAAPAENFTPFDAAICTGSPVRGLRPVRAARDERENEPNPGNVTLSSFATAL
jgi:hypothetical protein